MKNFYRTSYLFGILAGSMLAMQLGVDASALGAGQAAPQALFPSTLNESQPSASDPLADSEVAVADTKGDGQYSEGQRAIHEGRWADAEAIFGKLAQQHGEHSEGALYWKAYAENKQGHADTALKTCGELRQGYPGSRWIDECAALEIEIRSGKGQPIDPQSERDENLKLLALNALMHRDESKALPQLQQILAGNQPEEFKEHALFVLAQNDSKQTQKMMAGIANGSDKLPDAVRSNQALRQRAQQLIAAGRSGQSIGAQMQTSRKIGLDVVVSGPDGKSVAGLKPEDFTILDNGQPVKLTSFHAANEAVATANARPDLETEVDILIDTVNASLADVAFDRDQIELFLKQNGGRLSNSVSIYIFNGKGAQRIAPPSRDGNALAAALNNAASNLHPILRSEGFYGAEEKMELSLSALLSLSVEKGSVPGRKMVLWISSGWPVLESIDPLLTTNRTERTLFDSVVTMSTALRRARITLNCIDPFSEHRYEAFLAPVVNAGKVDYANLSLQVLSRQSGGEMMAASHGFRSGDIAKVVDDTDNYYYLSFDAAPASHADEYHSLKVTVNKPGLTVHTRNGYYDQP